MSDIFNNIPEILCQVMLKRVSPSIPRVNSELLLIDLEYRNGFGLFWKANVFIFFPLNSQKLSKCICHSHIGNVNTLNLI